MGKRWGKMLIVMGIVGALAVIVIVAGARTMRNGTQSSVR